MLPHIYTVSVKFTSGKNGQSISDLGAYASTGLDSTLRCISADGCRECAHSERLSGHPWDDGHAGINSLGGKVVQQTQERERGGRHRGKGEGERGLKKKMDMAMADLSL